MNARILMLACLTIIFLTACRQSVIPSKADIMHDTIATETNALLPTYTTLPSSTYTPEFMRESSTAEPKVKGLIDIGSRQMFINCTGSGTPVVILEAGWDDESDTWSTVQQEVAEFTRVCSYDRAGLGKSVPDPSPRSMDKELVDLHALLEEANIDGPYILVGHSYGGMLMRKFADRYPERVAGMVLVDSAHPYSYRRSLAVLPPESPNERDSVRFYREWFTNEVKDPTMKIDSGLLEAGSLGDLPLVVLTATQKERAEISEDLNDKFNRIWNDLQLELAQLSTNSSHVYAEQSGHFIQHDQPELVIETILEIVEGLR